MMSARPPYAPTGRPPPMILPRHVRSGRTPNTCCAPPAAARNPEITSSNTSSVPARSQSDRSPWRNPACGVTRPMLPAIGSTKIAATCPPALSRTWRTDSRSLYRATSVSAAAAAGTPGLVGTPSVMAPDPALHQERIGMAVIAALELDDLVSLRRRAGDARRTHRRFGSRADEPHALHRRHQHRDPVCELRFELRRCAEARAARRRCGERLQQSLRRMTVDQRPP